MTDNKNIDERDDDDDLFDEEDDRDPTPEDIKVLYQMLKDKRVEVAENIQRHLSTVTADSDNLPDEMDVATRQSEQAYFLRIADKEKKLLVQIDRALAKFERGVYGICEGTGEQIGLRRLMLRPWTRYSLEYKEAKERETKGAHVQRKR